MEKIQNVLTSKLKEAFLAAGYDPSYGEVRLSDRPDLCEYEFDHVFVGTYDGDVQVNYEEASEIRWISFEQLKEELAAEPEKFSSWFIICAPKVMAGCEW